VAQEVLAHQPQAFRAQDFLLHRQISLFASLLEKSLPARPQAGRKSIGEEDGAGRKQQFQTGIFTPFSERR